MQIALSRGGYPLADSNDDFVDGGLVLSRDDCRSVLMQVGRNPQLAGCDDLGAVIWTMAEGRGVLTPAGMYLRWSGISAGYMGVTFSLIASVTGTILVLRKIGVAGGISFMVLSRIAQSFGIEFDAAGAKITKPASDASTIAGMSAAVAEDTLLGFLPAGISNAAKALADAIVAGGEPKSVAERMELALGASPMGAFALFIYRALANMAGIKNDGPDIQLDDNQIDAACAALNIDPVEARQLLAAVSGS